MWAANEGQSDYFATQSCAKRAWGPQVDVNATFREQVGDYEKQACDEAYSEQQEQDLCYRSAAAGYSLALLLSQLSSEGTQPNFDTPSGKVARTTDNNHPAAQCRLDTYLQGALCTKSFDPEIIPGKKHPRGQGSLDAEKIAAKYSCTQQDDFSLGLRPACWFRSRLTSFLN
jgi:hypothetical protein